MIFIIDVIIYRIALVLLVILLYIIQSSTFICDKEPILYTFSLDNVSIDFIYRWTCETNYLFKVNIRPPWG